MLSILTITLPIFLLIAVGYLVTRGGMPVGWNGMTSP